MMSGTVDFSNYLHIVNKLQESKSIGTIAIAAVSLFLVYNISQIIYELYFSPLSKYPGPIWCHFSKIPVAYQLWTGNHTHWTHALHRKYGDVVRIAPFELSYTQPEAWKDICGHRVGTKGNMQKDPRFYGTGKNLLNGTPSMILANDEDHARVRKIFSNAFSDKAMKEQEPMFRTYVDLLVNKLKERTQAEPESKFNIVKWYNCTTFDVMGDLTFGEPLYMLENSEYVAWVNAIFQSIRMGIVFRVARYWPLVHSTLLSLAPKKLQEKRREHFNYSADRVNRRLAKDPDNARPDIWSLVLRQKEGRGLSLNEMHSNAGLFMVAGTETTATLLSGLTFLLLKNPEKLEKLTKEIRDAFQSEDEMTIGRLQQLEYLQACLEEALRMYPPVPTGMHRKTPAQGAEICGAFVPGDTAVYISHYAAYRSPKNFREPDSFIPERWLPDGGFDTDQKFALQPFSYGPRNCLGKNMAYHEMRMILSRMLWNFDYKLCEESANWADQKSYLLWEKHPLYVQLVPIRN